MTNLVLYRKYRPKTFAEIVGQEHVVKTLTNAISSGMVSHAYLFAGPRGCGKTSIARLLAKAVNCKSRKEGESEPCNKCDSCQEINQGNAIDLIEIDAASNRGIDEIRDLRDGIRFVPTKSKYKVFIVDECLTGDHLITLANGDVKKISEIKNEEEVASINLKTGEIVSGKVENWFKRETNKIIKIRTPQATLKCTSTHRLWIFRDNRFLLLEAKNLKRGDFLLSPLSLPHIRRNNLTPAQLALLALIQCDGHVSKDSITVQLEIQKDREYFTKVAKEGFKAWNLKKEPVIRTTSRGTRLIRIYSKKLKDTLISLGCPQGRKGKKIDIPDVVFQAPLESVRAYIDTCFCCEGNIDFNESLNLYRLHFNSTSKIFAKKLQLLLKKFGISSNFLKIPRKKRGKNHSDQYRLYLSHYNLKIFHKKIGLSLRRKAEILTKCSLEKEKQDTIPIEKIIIKKQKEIKLPYSLRASLGIYPDLRQHLSRKAVVNFMRVGGLPELNKYLQFRYEKIKKLTVVNKKEQVYDFTVRGTHTFIANGICSSNSHQLTKEASNALLKTLEEPPSHAIFVLATTEAHKMIPTIISRCQRFDFRRLTMPEIIGRLETILKKEKIDFEKEALNLIALSATGSIRDAESLLDEVVSFSGKERTVKKEIVEKLLGVADKAAIFQFLNFLNQKKAKEAVEFLNEIIFKGVDLKEFTKSLIQYLREILLLKIDSQFQNPLFFGFSQEEKEEIKNLASQFSDQELQQLLEKFMAAEDKMKFSSIPQLPLELAIIEICQKKE